MPPLKKWKPDTATDAIIWEIGETEAFFMDATGLSSDIKSDKRRIERLAGRFLLQTLREDFPIHDIVPDEFDKPRIPNNKYHFSISHSYPYVAAMVSERAHCGLDIQIWHDRMTQLQHKFLSGHEQRFFMQDARLITLSWCAKEAAYKWLGRRGIDFIEHLKIKSYTKCEAKYLFAIDVIYNGICDTIRVDGTISESFAFAMVVI